MKQKLVKKICEALRSEENYNCEYQGNYTMIDIFTNKCCLFTHELKKMETTLIDMKNKGINIDLQYISTRFNSEGLARLTIHLIMVKTK